MKSSTNLREALFVFFSLTVITILNAGQLIEQQKVSIHYLNIQLLERLDLDLDQIERIRSVNVSYQTKATGLREIDEELRVERINELLRERNKEIISILRPDQQKVLYTYCTDLVSFLRTVE